LAVLNIENYNTAFCFTWASNLVSDNEERAKAEGVREQVLRKRDGTERKEVAGDWRRLHNEQLRGL